MNAYRKIVHSPLLQAFAIMLATSTSVGTARAAEGEAFKEILGAIGFIEKDRAPIQYRERAPLVLPPRSDLPPPVARTSLRNAESWPKDPEVAARAKQAARDAEPRGVGIGGRHDDKQTRLSIYEMRAGRRPGAGVPTEADFQPKRTDREEAVLSPFQLLQGKKDDTEVASLAEPERSLLSDPPSGYRRPPGGTERGAREVQRSLTDAEIVDPLGFIRQQSGR